jgi:hypothetical protein
MVRNPCSAWKEEGFLTPQNTFGMTMFAVIRRELLEL